MPETIYSVIVLAGFLVPLAGLVTPIVLWQIKKTEYPEIDEHGKAVVNWMITMVIVGAALGLVYGLVVRREEAHLLRKYGKPYAAYLREVPPWIPQIGGKRQDVPRRRRVRHYLWPSIVAELHCLLWVLPLIGKELLSQWR